MLGNFIKSSGNFKTMFLWEAFICYFELLILDNVTLVAQFSLKFKFINLEAVFKHNIPDITRNEKL